MAVAYPEPSQVLWCHMVSLGQGQNGCHFPDDILKEIFFNQNVWISIKILLKFAPNGPIDDIPALVQKMAWWQAIIWTNDG